MSTLRERLAHLSREERSALERQLLQQARPQHGEARPAPGGPPPLSFAQESLWFFDQLAPASPLYNIPAAYHMEGPLQRPVLARAIETLVQRHPALHTRFRDEHGVPLQVPEPQPFCLDFLDLAPLPEAERASAARTALDEFIRRPFRLAEDLMLRARLICLRATEHLFALVLHHIVSDFTSLEILLRELGELYEAALQGKGAELGPPPASFPAWAAEQRRRFEAGNQNRDLEYWQEQLTTDGGEGTRRPATPPPLALPTDRPRPAQASFSGARRVFELSPRLATAVPELSRQENVTRYMLLLAAFQVLLSRFSGQKDFLIGTPVNQRGDPGTEQAVGFFLNTVVLRADLKGNPSFRDLLQRTRRQALAAFSHASTPFEKLVETLRLKRVPGVNPLCQAVFQALPSGWPIPKLTGLRTEFVPVDTGTAKFDLTLTVYEADESALRGDLEFNTDLFDLRTADQWVRSFERLLEAVVADPSQSVARLPLLSPDEERLVLQQGNETAAPYPRNACVHELFEAQAQAHPESVALAQGGESLTYAALNQRANQLAHRLVQLGARPGELIGIALERSFDTIAALLGILKAGAAYVPFDPNHPPDRLASLLQNAGARWLLTRSKIAERFPPGLQCLLLDAHQDSIANCSTENLPRRAAADSLAYLLYTSGSTGEPKGVAVPHRAIVRLVSNTNYAQFGPEEVFLQFAPLAFDASTFEIWGPLLNGAKLVLYPPQFESLEQFGSVLRTHRVTTLWLTAGLFQQIIDHQIEALGQVRQLLAGGDVLSVPHVLRALRELPHCQLINGYGPTENTTFSCCYRFPRDWDGTRSAPIGRPISHSQAYILDDELVPVPVGVAGELCLAGDGLAQGYWKSADLTARKFVTFERTGARIYRTGDQARYLPDGTIEFLGRVDDQVKINGFRIHLAEVEAMLQQLPGVRQAAVTCPRGPTGGKQLIAYVVLDPAAPTQAAGLRQAAETKLPAYMVPSRFITLEELPLTKNGKVDRARLPVPGEATNAPARKLSAPENPDQERILQIWKEIFGHEQIGIDDSFFDLGGHSLMATRVISRVNQAFGRNLSLASLFEAGTIRALAQRIAQAEVQPALGPIRRRSAAASPASSA